MVSHYRNIYITQHSLHLNRAMVSFLACTQPKSCWVSACTPKSRSVCLTGGSGVGDRVMAQLLSEMDGLQQRVGVVVSAHFDAYLSQSGVLFCARCLSPPVWPIVQCLMLAWPTGHSLACSTAALRHHIITNRHQLPPTATNCHLTDPDRH